jgi:hypothetical protein
VVAAMNHLPVKSCPIDGRNDDRPVGLGIGRLLTAKARRLS